MIYRYGQVMRQALVFKIQTDGLIAKLGVNTNCDATIFVSPIHFDRRTSSEVEVTQRTLVTAEDLGIFLAETGRKICWATAIA